MSYFAISIIINVIIVALAVWSFILKRRIKKLTKKYEEQKSTFNPGPYIAPDLNQKISENGLNIEQHKFSGSQIHIVSDLNDDHKDETYSHHHHNDSDSTDTSNEPSFDGGDSGDGGGD